jgi:16S rRNA (guanine1207-N2)-methyltransferase
MNNQENHSENKKKETKKNKTEHYFSENPKSKEEKRIISFKIKEFEFELYSANSIFSKNELDLGTKILLENLQQSNTENPKILDLGCGYGIIAIYNKLINPKAIVYASDINKRAIRITKLNIKKLNLDINAIHSNVFDKIDSNFDVIICNLPTSAGNKVIFKIIEQSYLHLNKNGIFQVVFKTKTGGKTVKNKILETFNNYEKIAIKSGFRVAIARKE